MLRSLSTTGFSSNDLLPVESTMEPPGPRNPSKGRDSGGGKVYGQTAEGLPPTVLKREKDMQKEIADLKKKLEEARSSVGGGLTEEQKQGLEDLENFKKNNEIEIGGKKHTLVILKDYENLLEELKDMQEKNNILEDEKESIVNNAKSQIDTLSNDLKKAKESNEELQKAKETALAQAKNIIQRNVKNINVKMDQISVQINAFKEEEKEELQKDIAEVAEEIKQIKEQAKQFPNPEGAEGIKVGGGDEGEVVVTTRSSSSEESGDVSTQKISQELSKVSTLVSELNKLELRSKTNGEPLNFSEDDQAMIILDETLRNSEASLPEEINKLIGYPVSNVTNIDMDKFTKSLELFYLLDNGPKDGKITVGDIEDYYVSMKKREILGSTLYNSLAKTENGKTNPSISIVEWIEKEPHNNKDFPVPKHWGKKVESPSESAMFVSWL